MKHPFEAIPVHRRKTVFWALLFTTLVIMLLMNIIGAPLNTSSAPAGIVSFELAGTSDRAQEIIQSWDSRAQLFAALGLGFDYVFMLAYAALISLACLIAGDALTTRRWPLAGLGVPLAWGLWLAALMDAIENLGLILILLNGAGAPWPAISRVCAIIKFALIIAGLCFALYGWVASLVQRQPAVA
jgi:hypothetical protein